MLIGVCFYSFAQSGRNRMLHQASFGAYKVLDTSIHKVLSDTYGNVSFLSGIYSNTRGEIELIQHNSAVYDKDMNLIFKDEENDSSLYLVHDPVWFLPVDTFVYRVAVKSVKEHQSHLGHSNQYLNSKVVINRFYKVDNKWQHDSLFEQVAFHRNETIIKISFCRFHFGYLGIAVTSEGAYCFNLSNSSIDYIDSLKQNWYQKFAIQHKNVDTNKFQLVYDGYSYGLRQDNFVTLSPNGKHVAIKLRFRYETKITDSEKNSELNVYHFHFLLSLDSGQIRGNSLRLVDSSYSISVIDNNGNRFNNNSALLGIPCFSPSGRYLYYSKYEKSPFNVTGAFSHKKVYKFDTRTDLVIDSIDTEPNTKDGTEGWLSSDLAIGLTPEGYLFVWGYATEFGDRASTNKGYISGVFVINPDSSGKITLSQRVKLFYYHPSIFSTSPQPMDSPFLFDYVKCKVNIAYACISASVRFNNLSIESGGIHTYHWEVKDSTGKIIHTATSKNTLIDSMPEGIYSYKLTAWGSNRYMEILHGEFEVKIPQAPQIISIAPSDSVFCAFNPIPFSATVQEGGIIGQNKNQWLWHFGNGNTSTQAEPQYFYPKDGYKTLQLVFSNGFCADTLEKRLYIAASPEPGLVLNDTQGCIPFELNLQYTGDVSKVAEASYFIDGLGWQNWNNLSQNRLETLIEPRTYQIILRLLGINGCITQLDSQTVNLKPGIAANDTSYISLATHDENDSFVHFFWNKNPKAIRYVFKTRNTQGNIAEYRLNDTFFVLPKQSESFNYSVACVDACGNTNGITPETSPIRLNIIDQKNNIAQLQYTPYQGYAYAPMAYQSIYSFDGKNWFDLYAQPALRFEDTALGSANEPLRYYRMVGKSGSHISLSNITRAEVSPLFWFPNAFSPNKNGLNEVFYPVGMGLETVKLKIYNRWGQLLSDLENKPWTGEGAPTGLYVYQYTIITYTGKRYYGKGTINLMR